MHCNDMLNFVLQPTEEASNIIVLPEGEMQSDQPRVRTYFV